MNRSRTRQCLDDKGVGHSENVILYREHLRDSDDTSTTPDGDVVKGIRKDEIVSEQIGIHSVPDDHPGAYIDIEPPFGTKYHSNVHVGELHWGSDPTVPNLEQLDEQTSLDVEVDWIRGYSTFTSVRNGRTVLERAEENLGLYGLNVNYYRDDKLSYSELKNIWKLPSTSISTCDPSPLTPETLNRYELDLIEDKYHNDTNRLHLLWGSDHGADCPATIIDVFSGQDYESATGQALHVGSPNGPGLLTATCLDGNCNQFGIEVDGADTSDFDEAQSVLMHETGHALSIGWLDDMSMAVGGAVAPHGREVYSGDVQGKVGPPDETPEHVVFPGSRERWWSLMQSGTARDISDQQLPRYAYSIEELMTIDFEEIPSKNG